ncbi:MAG: electron transfer flavoprotein-ubiquinone oxidoreductase [Rhodocyclaceae bacterium]|nr:electron transfer flavoprotein-ubiquinone oxidoreductase [Rhodocyclaceae bacterium]
MEREEMEFDVLVVGGGPAGLACAIRLKQLAAAAGRELSVCLLEKGAEIGAHILSGAVFETRALDELIPDWRARGAPLGVPVLRDEVYYFPHESNALRLPGFALPKTMHNAGNYVISLGKLCRWLGSEAEALGVEIFPGFAAAELLIEAGVVTGVVTGELGRAKDGSEKPDYQPGMALKAKYTVFAEGCRGHLGKALIERFDLAAGRDPQHYAIGLKELWEVPAERHEPGLVVHGAGWPLEGNANGGSFLYHGEDNTIAVGLIVDLNYANPYLSPFEEFQRFKQHPVIRRHLAGGRRIAYGARAIAKGGFSSLPKMHFPGGLLIGCDAGTLNFAKIKGSHTAMKSGLIAAETIFAALEQDRAGGRDLVEFETALRASWLYEELYAARNFGAALHRFGTLFGGAFNWIDQNLFGGRLPVTLHDPEPDHMRLKPAAECAPIVYEKPDGVISFDRLSSVFLSNTNHEEDQPAHLKLTDPGLALTVNLARYAAPETRYCPAGVYEIVEEAGGPRLVINAQNCLHCKTCDIKDPGQNIRWLPPEGGGGPVYGAM